MKLTRPALQREWSRGFSAGVLSALYIIHAAGQETYYDEIMVSCGDDEIMREAKRTGNLEHSGVAEYRKRRKDRRASDRFHAARLAQRATVPQMAKRIQRQRTKGWKLPPNTVIVSRPTRWGNPFRLGTPNADDCMVCATREEAVAKYRSELTTFAAGVNFTGCTLQEIRDELRGKDLACWCPLVDKEGNKVPCHADVLLELSNG